MEASVGSCVLSVVYVLAIEWMTPKYRVLSNTVLSIAYPIGEMLVGLTAMFVHDYRILIRIMFTPGVFVILLFFLLPESVRWLLVTGRIDRAIDTLKRMAKVNRRQLSAKSIELIKMNYSTKYNKETESSAATDDANNENRSVIKSLLKIAKSKRLGPRFLNACYQWIACTFSYYGLSMTSTHIPGADRYLSFIIVMGSEIPGVLAAQFLLDRMKRRILMFLSLFVSAILIITSPLIPKEQSTIVLVFFVFGKASITVNVFVWRKNVTHTDF